MESEDDVSFLQPTEVSMDRINELPDEVLTIILSSLLTREAARTCVLSRRWGTLWKSSVSWSSTLNLDVLHMSGSPFLYVGELPTERDEFVRWVDMILQLDHSPLKESIKLCAFLFKNHSPLIDQWIQLAIDKRVQNYHIDFSHSHYPTVPTRSMLYTFPYWLFTQDSGSLVKCLFLKSCAFGLRDSNIFTSLRDLHLEFGRLNESKLRRILSNCPSLEKLGIINCAGMLSLEISGNSLKLQHLTVVTNHPLSTIMIDAKNLTTFHFVGKSRDFLFRSVPQLSNVSISAKRRNACARLSYDLGKLSTDMPKLESLVLSFAVANENFIPNQSSLCANLKKLNLTLHYVRTVSLWGIIHFLQACPYLQTLELHLTTTCGEEQQMQRPTDYIHRHLREIILEGFICHSHDMDFVTYLLINAIALEKLIFIYQTRHSNLTSAESSCQRIKVDANACEQLASRLRPDVEFLLL